MSEDIKKVGGVWLPQHERHMTEWMAKKNVTVDGALTYQYHKLQAAMEYVKNFRVAVDIGAHCGLWSMHLVKRFEYVHAFEPIKVHRQCFGLNVKPGNHTIYPCALGEEAGTVAIATTNGSSGDTKVVPGGGEYTLKRLDDVLDAGCVDHDKVDFVKVDCEGYEYFALKGGEELLTRCKPCVIVEQKPGYARRYGLTEKGAVAFLESLGATMRKEIGGDFILSW